MKNRIYTLIVLLAFALTGMGEKQNTVKLKLLHTSDVHGNFFTRDFINNKPSQGGLSRFYSYVKKQRSIWGDNLILTDGGDFLQGEPMVYYYNFIDTLGVHPAASVMNFIGYDAACIGNHDVETGLQVYNRWIKDCNFPILGANVIEDATGLPYLKPYVILNKQGVKIAILGLTTPAIPFWLPRELWKGLHFDNLTQSAQYWMKILREKENPDLIIGLIHSGKEGGIETPDYKENAVREIAEKVCGFDLICYGHDHITNCEYIRNIEGDSVLCIDPSSKACYIGEVEIEFTIGKNKKTHKINYENITDISDIEDSYIAEFEQYFRKEIKSVEAFVNHKIGYIEQTITCRDAYFGSSVFVDLIHKLQLEVTGADISFSAPLVFDAEIKKGDVKVCDMFNLYKYENMIYTMRFTGKEIKGALEMSYALWTNQMKTASDHIMLLDSFSADNRSMKFKNMAFNFDSAAGLIYTVDVTKPEGEKIHIQSLANGHPFFMDSTYLVATNSYRGNGGGELFTKGADIAHNELSGRILKSTDKDLRFYLIQYIKEKKRIYAKPMNQWRFIPEEWTIPACKRDRSILFPDE